MNEAHKLSTRQFETGGTQKRKSLGVSMERSSDRWFNPSQEYRHWESRRISERISRTSGCGCDPFNRKQTNSTTTTQKRELRDSREALPRARTSRHLSQAQAGKRPRGRDAEVLLDAIRIRNLSEALDCSPLAVLSSFGGESRRCGRVAQLPLARGSKAKIRNLMSALYSHAIRWEWAEKNPIKRVRQSAKRSRVPDVLTHRRSRRC